MPWDFNLRFHNPNDTQVKQSRGPNKDQELYSLKKLVVNFNVDCRALVDCSAVDRGNDKCAELDIERLVSIAKAAEDDVKLKLFNAVEISSLEVSSSVLVLNNSLDGDRLVMISDKLVGLVADNTLVTLSVTVLVDSKVVVDCKEEIAMLDAFSSVLELDF